MSRVAKNHATYRDDARSMLLTLQTKSPVPTLSHEVAPILKGFPTPLPIA